MADAYDLLGQRFGKLLVVERLENNKRNNTMWRCLCDCGKERVALGYDLTHNRTKSCGHHRVKQYEDLSGKKYGKLTVISMVRKNKRKLFCVCACDCGNVTTVCTDNLQSGHTQSCGCLNIIRTRKMNKPIEKKLSKWQSERLHYGSLIGIDGYKKLRCEWNSMKNRCKENYHGRHIYFDRGITVCDEWMEFSVFADWAINNGYDNSLSLDRKDNEKGYSPDNCRWVLWKVQANNTRHNVYIEYMGKTQTMKQWCEELKLSYGAIRARYHKGIDVPMLFAPVTKHNPRKVRT